MSHRIHIQAKIQVCASHPRSQSNRGSLRFIKNKSFQETSRSCDTTSIFFTLPHKLFIKYFHMSSMLVNYHQSVTEEVIIYFEAYCMHIGASSSFSSFSKVSHPLHFDDFFLLHIRHHHIRHHRCLSVITCPVFFPPSAENSHTAIPSWKQMAFFHIPF